MYLPGGVGLKVIVMQVSVQIGLNKNYQLELSLARKKKSLEYNGQKIRL